MIDLERRILQAPRLELRASADGKSVTLAGYAAVFDSQSEELWGFRETVAAGAFAETIKSDDIRLLINHDGLALARTKSETLSLREDETGLLVEADLDAGSPIVQGLRSAMQRNDVDQMSFGFETVRDEWSPDYRQRRLLEVKLWDVSVVTFPAYPETSASVRSLVDSHKKQAERDVLKRRFALRRRSLETERLAVLQR